MAWRCARECLHAIAAMCVRAMVCMEMCARNRARLCGCAEAATFGEVERGMEMGRTCMHALATHPLTPLPASGRPLTALDCAEYCDDEYDEVKKE